jgi:phosphatidylinositol alpha-mannosyltransferase
VKVALVSPYSWTTPGGVNIHIAGLARELQARGHEVRILAPADGDVEPGVIALGRTIGVPFNGSVARVAFGPRVTARVRVALRRARADVVHVHEPFTVSTSMLAAMASKVPVVATFHVAAPDSRAYRLARAPLGPLWRKIAVKIAVSRSARATVERVFGPGARIVPNGIDTHVYDDVGEVEPGSKSVLFFGRLEQRKGAQVLVDALPELFRAVPDAQVVIAGGGPLRDELTAKVGSERRVHLTGEPFEESERVPLLSAASVVCLPALGGESFGVTLLEAMAAGRPIVASDISGYAGVARAGIDADLVEPGNAAALAAALARALTDPEHARALAASARARAARFDWRVVADEVEDVYREALERPAAGAG